MKDTALRIDIWLWYTRFFKTRSLSAHAVKGGHVRINGERAKTARTVKAGDRLEVTKDQLTYVLDVLSIPARRGPATEAARCYAEDPDALAKRLQQLADLKRDRLLMPRTEGRPDKHTRRRIRAFNSKS